jgi:hypothetical protein
MYPLLKTFYLIFEMKKSILIALLLGSALVFSCGKKADSAEAEKAAADSTAMVAKAETEFKSTVETYKTKLGELATGLKTEVETLEKKAADAATPAKEKAELPKMIEQLKAQLASVEGLVTKAGSLTAADLPAFKTEVTSVLSQMGDKAKGILSGFESMVAPGADAMMKGADAVNDAAKSMKDDD